MKWYFKTVIGEYRRIFASIDFVEEIRDGIMAFAGIMLALAGSVLAVLYLIFALWWLYPLVRIAAIIKIKRTFRRHLKMIRGGKLPIMVARGWVRPYQKNFPELREVQILCRAVALQDAKKRREYAKELSDA